MKCTSDDEDTPALCKSFCAATARSSDSLVPNQSGIRLFASHIHAHQPASTSINQHPTRLHTIRLWR